MLALCCRIIQFALAVADEYTNFHHKAIPQNNKTFIHVKFIQGNNYVVVITLIYSYQPMIDKVIHNTCFYIQIKYKY